MKKTIISATIFLAIIILFNIFLSSQFYLRLLENQNGQSYFYISYDWMKKAQMGVTLPHHETTIFLGSSRTSYSINPEKINSDIINLSLMAGSYNEINLLSSSLKINNIKVKKAYIELNPTSATMRHMKAMSAQSTDDIFGPYLDSSLFSKFQSMIHNTPIYLNHYILRDMIEGYVRGTGDTFDSYKKMKRANHLNEFTQITDDHYKGFLPGMKIPDEHLTRSFDECNTMLNWIMGDDKEDDLKQGLSKFHSTILNLKAISAEVIVWIPPSPVERQLAKREEYISNELIKIAQNLQVKIIDLRSNKNLSKLTFFDCIHPDNQSAERIQNELIKN